MNTQCISYFDSPVGRLFLEADDAGLIGLWFEGSKHFLVSNGCKCFLESGGSKRFLEGTDAACQAVDGMVCQAMSGTACQAMDENRDPNNAEFGWKERELNSPDPNKRPWSVLDTAKRWFDVYFSGREPGFAVPLHLTGTEFQMDVWQILLGIPYGKTATYGEIAKQMAEKRGMRRMSAQAVGQAIGRNKISIIVPCHRVVGTNGRLTGYGGGLDKKIRLLEIEGADMGGFRLNVRDLKYVASSNSSPLMLQ